MNRNLLIGGIILLLAAFATGRYTAPEKVKVETKTVEVEKVKEKIKTVVVKNPDGSSTTTTIVDRDSSKGKETDTTKEVDNKKSSTSISALAGIDITNPAKGYVFGAHVSKRLLGPIEFGVFGLTNGTAGISAGLRF